MTSPLLSVSELRELLVQPAPPVLLDVRWRLGGPPGRQTYEAGHLPGARFTDLEADLADRPSHRGRHPLPPPEVFVAAMRGGGLHRDEHVVVYDDADSTSAARLWWLLRHYGHAAVRVLDGGYAAWLSAGGPVETGPGQTVPEGDFAGTPGAMPVLDADATAALARAGVLLDARAGARYRGEEEPIDPIAGHVPGALSAPTGDAFGADGRFLPVADLLGHFTRLGATGGRPVGVYCGSGVTAAHEVLALELVGVRAALYPGSWSEWVAQGRPVATGTERR